MAALENLEAEAELLGSLMQTSDAIDRTADILAADDFSEPVHGRIYSAIVEQHARGKPANPITLKGFFDGDDALTSLGGPGYLARLTGNCTMLSTKDIADQVRELAERRRMREKLQIAVADCADLTVPTAEIVALADDALGAGDSTSQLTGAECFDELIRGFDEPALGVECGVIPSVDSLLGPMRPKQLIIGAGRPGMGKTALALSYSIGAAANGHGVLFVSLEMSSHELAARMAADMCFREGRGIPFSQIRDGRLNREQKIEVMRTRDAMARLPFHVVDTGRMTMARLNMLVRRHARRFAAQEQKLELVVVDYLQLLSPDTRLRSNYEAVSEVSRSLKAIAKENGVAVFALAQLSREVEKRTDKRPQLADLRDSGQIEQDADAVLFLTRQEYYHRLDEPDRNTPDWDEWNRILEAMRGEIEFICAKRRNGTTGSAKGRFYGGNQAVRG